MSLVYPGSPEFDLALTTLPLGWQHYANKHNGNIAFVAEPGSGLLRPASVKEMTEYLYGGEYNERLMEIDAME